MQKRYIIIFCFLFFSCNYLPESIGDNNDLIIITSDQDREFVSLCIEPITSIFVNTPVEENIYDIKWIKPEDFKNYMNYKNIMILSLTHPNDSTIDLLSKKFSNTISDKDIYLASDVYAKNQIIICVNAYDSNHLNFLISNYLDWLLEQIDNNIYSNVLNAFNNSNINNEINSLLSDKFEISFHIDENYKVIKDKKDFLWIGRGYPYRWLIFNKIKTNKNNNYWNIIESTLEENINGLNIRNDFKSIDVKNNYLYRGIYDYDISDTGGPFFTYVFENNINKEVILISGFVSNPGKDKYPLLNQLETIITKTKVNTNE